MLEATYAHLADPVTVHAVGEMDERSRTCAPTWPRPRRRTPRRVRRTPAPSGALRPGTLVGVGCAGFGIDFWSRTPSATSDAPGTQWNLRHLYLMPGAHGSGLADELMDALLPDGHEAYLWVMRENHRAIRFYEKRGFVDIGPHTNTGESWGSMAMTRMQRL